MKVYGKCSERGYVGSFLRILFIERFFQKREMFLFNLESLDWFQNYVDPDRASKRGALSLLLDYALLRAQ